MVCSANFQSGILVTTAREKSHSPLTLPAPSTIRLEQESQSGPPGQSPKSRPQRRCFLFEGVLGPRYQTVPETDQGFPSCVREDFTRSCTIASTFWLVLRTGRRGPHSLRDTSTDDLDLGREPPKGSGMPTGNSHA